MPDILVGEVAYVDSMMVVSIQVRKPYPEQMENTVAGDYSEKPLAVNLVSHLVLAGIYSRPVSFSSFLIEPVPEPVVVCEIDAFFAPLQAGAVLPRRELLPDYNAALPTAALADFFVD